MVQDRAMLTIHSHTYYGRLIGSRHIEFHTVSQIQLSQTDREMLRVVDYFGKSLKVTQGHTK